MSDAVKISASRPSTQKTQRFSFGASKLKKQPSVEIHPAQLNPLGDRTASAQTPWDRNTLNKVTVKRQSLEQYNQRKSNLRLSVFNKPKSAAANLKSVEEDDINGEPTAQAKQPLCCGSLRLVEERWQRTYGRSKGLQMAGPAFDRVCIVVDFLSDVAVLSLIAEKKETNYGLYQFALFLFFFPYIALWLILYSPLLKLVKAFAVDGNIDAARAKSQPEETRPTSPSLASTINPALTDGADMRKQTASEGDRKVSDRKAPERLEFKKKRTKAAERRAHTRMLIWLCSGARIDLMFTVIYFFSGFFGFWAVDFTLATRYLCVDMEGRKSRWKEYLVRETLRPPLTAHLHASRVFLFCQVYYEKLRKLVECTCEAIPQILFQVYILFRANDAIEIDWRLLIISVCISIVVLLLRVREIRRGARYRQISVREHMRQILSVGKLKRNSSSYLIRSTSASSYSAPSPSYSVHPLPPCAPLITYRSYFPQALARYRTWLG
jgi:hypothetical protein